VVSNPEFLREGTAVQDFLHPDRIVVGADSERAARLLSAIYAPLTSGSLLQARPDGIPGAARHGGTAAAAADLDQERGDHQARVERVSGAEDFVYQCGVQPVRGADANVEQVARGIGLDSRIGPKFLRPGIGYGGSCFPEGRGGVPLGGRTDGRGLQPAERGGEDQRQPEEALSEQGALGAVDAARQEAGVLGLAFKGETDDIRESPAIDLVEMLLAEGCSVWPTIRPR
jgi:UDPglucose 6-dehydrogenase